MELSNFDLIGFAYENLENGFAFDAMPEATVEQREMQAHAFLTILKDRNGAEIWLTQSADGEPITANPVFLKGSDFTIGLDAWVPSGAPYDFYESGTTLSIYEEGELATRAQVILVNVPASIATTSRGLLGRKKVTSEPAPIDPNVRLKVRLSVFSMETEVFADEDAYYAVTKDMENPMGSTSFIPGGMFADEDGSTSPHGFGVGKVLSCGTHQTDFIGKAYNWAVVGAIGGSFGVCWSPQQAPAAQKGGYIAYSGTLIGKQIHS